MKRLQPLEKANMSILLNLLLLSLIFALLFFFLLHIFISINLTVSISPGFTQVNILDRGEDRHPLRLVFSRPNHSYPQIFGASLSDSDIPATHSTASHFLSMDLIFPSLVQKNAFCAALAVLELASQMSDAKVFIS